MAAHVEPLRQMDARSPRPSARLLRAVAAEQKDLQRRRERLLEQRQLVQSRLDEIDAAVAEVDDRLILISRLAKSGDEPSPAQSLRTTQRLARPSDSSRGVLQGPAIRMTAVRVLLSHPQRPEALHYREWLGMLEAAGYQVAGKDPLAVFLTQLSRSPVVRRGTQSGVYELDAQAPERLRHRLEGLHGELRALTSAPHETANLSAVRGHRTSLNREIGRTEKALEEAQQALERDVAATDFAVAS